jgi:membrane-associated phospholipid phosphatase
VNVDIGLLHDLNAFFFRHDLVEDPAVAYANAAEALFLGALILAFVLVRGHRRRGARHAVVAAGLSAGLALAMAQVLSRIVDRPRPFVADPSGVHLFAHHAADAGFPSDHATAAFAIAVAILLRHRGWGAVTLVAAAVLAIARVGMGIHYPSDVLAGAALGSACALILWHPRVRAALHALADLAGRLLDGAVAAVLLTAHVRHEDDA